MIYTIDVTRKYERILLLLLYPLAPFLFFLSKRRKREFGNSPKIFIVTNLTRIGDVIASTPVFRAIKERYPKAYISVLVSIKTADILAQNKNIDRLIIIEHQKYNFSRFIKELRQENFDIGLSLGGTALSSLLFIFALIPMRLKLCRRPRPLKEILTDWTATNKFFFPHHVSVTRFFLSMLKALDISSENSKKEIAPTEEGEKKAESFIRKHDLSDHKLVGLTLSAGNKIKEWGVPRFGKLMEMIAAKYSVKFVVIGSMSDKVKIEELREMSNLNFVEATDFSLGELPSLIKRFSIFISGNTGSMHIADALGIPTVVVNGPVDDKELIPENTPFVLVKPEPPVPPTIFAFKPAGDPKLSLEALKNTSVEDVFSAFEKLYRSKYQKD